MSLFGRRPKTLDPLPAAVAEPLPPLASGQNPGAAEALITIPAPAPREGRLAVLEQTGHRFAVLKESLTEALREVADPGGDSDRSPEAEEQLRTRFLSLLEDRGVSLDDGEREELWQAVQDELYGLGPLEPLLRDDSLSEVMVNGPHLVYVERRGRIYETDVVFADEAHVMRAVDRILRPLGRRVEPKWPLSDARLPDGSRVNVIVPPCALNGPTITIRKFAKKPFTIDDLIRFGSLTEEMGQFLRACVLARLNIVVAGGTGSGKTTLLNVLSSFIPDDERIVTIEDSAELQLRQRHVVTLEARQADPDGSGRVAIRDLVVNSLRMRPERIVVGECRSGETLDMLQAMNTGHDGSLTTLHANTPRDVIARLETMVMMSGMNLPMAAIRSQIAAAIDLIVLQSRMRDGTRKVVNVTEVQGMEGEMVVLQDVFAYKEKGIGADGHTAGSMEPIGIRPRFMPRLEAKGIILSPRIFGVEPMDPVRGRP